MRPTRPLPLFEPGFRPPRCPRQGCSAHDPNKPFPHRRRGTFVRARDAVRIQRFDCLTCGRSFSISAFRLDYRLKRPELLASVFEDLNAKSTLRKTARRLGLRLDLVEHRLRLLGQHCREFHLDRMRRIAAKGGLEGPFLLDELETYETDRKLKPVTVPLLVEGRTWFILHVGVAPLAPRRPLTEQQQARLEKIEAVEGKRKSGSRAAVKRAFESLARVVPKEGSVCVRTDKKASYATILAKLFGERLEHARIEGRRQRGSRNPLFPINHTLARARDLVSRLVRQTWAASKRRERLEAHLWVMAAFRNYVDGWRSKPAARQRVSAAQELGAVERRLSAEEFLQWRDPLLAPP